MRIQTVYWMAFICVLVAVCATNWPKGTIAMDKIHNSRILTGKKRFDFVEVMCVSKLVNGDIVHDYCDDSPIQRIEGDDGFYYIIKRDSIWKYYPEVNGKEASLKLQWRKYNY